MHDRLRQAMGEGASGFSTVLWYPPAMHAPTEEVIAVAEAIRPFGGIYATHVRDEADCVLASIEEVWCNGVPTYVAARGATGEKPGRLVTRGR